MRGYSFWIYAVPIVSILLLSEVPDSHSFCPPEILLFESVPDLLQEWLSHEYIPENYTLFSAYKVLHRLTPSYNPDLPECRNLKIVLQYNFSDRIHCKRTNFIRCKRSPHYIITSSVHAVLTVKNAFIRKQNF